MKPVNRQRALGAVIAVGLTFLTACSRPNISSQSVEKSSLEFRQASLDDNNNPAVPYVQAIQILRWNAVATSTYGSGSSTGADANQDRFSQLQSTDTYKGLLENANAVVKGSQGNVTDIISQFPAWTPAERGNVAQDSLGLLTSAASDYSRAAAAHNLTLLAQAEATLMVVHGDLRNVCEKNGIAFPENAYDLLDNDSLNSVDTNLARQQRGLEEMAAISLDPVPEDLARTLQARRSEIQKSLQSPSRVEFQTRKAQILGKIPDKDYSERAADQEARIAQSLANRKQEWAALIGHEEMLLFGSPALGPPESWAISVVDDFNCAPTDWCENYAKLNSLGDAMLDAGLLPQNVGADTDPLGRGLMALDNETLKAIATQAKTELASHPAATPQRLLYGGRDDLLIRLASGVATELNRRMGGASQVKVPAAMLNVAVPPASQRYKTRLVDVIFDRFDKPEYRPATLQSEYEDILKESVTRYSDQIDQQVKNCAKLSRQAVLSSGVVPDGTVADIKSMRKVVSGMAAEFDRFAGKLENLGISVTAQRQKAALALALFSMESEPPPGATPAETPLSDVQRVAATEKIAPNSYRLENDLNKLDAIAGRVEASLKECQAKIDKLPSADPIPVGTVKGRLIAQENALLSNNFLAKVDNEATRYPPADKNFVGRLDKSGLPYKYDEVKYPTKFEVLGGGIHFGTTAQPEGTPDLSGAVLIYEPDKGLLFRDGKSGQEWIIDQSIDPTSLRALYRFVVAQRNAAISIGWGGGWISGTEELDAYRKNPTEAVLLDPYLADTRVGQELLVADSIPWQLGNIRTQKGQLLSVSDKFKSARWTYYTSTLNKLEDAFASVKPVKQQDPTETVRYLEQFYGFADELLLLKFSAPSDEAKAYYTKRKYAEIVFEKFSSYEKSAKTDLIKAPEKIDPAKLDSTAAEVAKAELKEYLQVHGAEVASTIDASYNKIAKDFASQSDRDYFEYEAMAHSFGVSLPPNRAMVESWVAAQLGVEPQTGKKYTLKDISKELYALMNPTTLAVLYDDATTLRLSEKSADIDVKCKYRYATSFIEISDSRIGLTQDADGSEVDTINDLTEMANNALPEIIAGFPSIQDVRRYAGVAAVLRWAENASQDGRLGMIDFTELAQFKTNDRSKYPTVDALIPAPVSKSDLQ